MFTCMGIYTNKMKGSAVINPSDIFFRSILSTLLYRWLCSAKKSDESLHQVQELVLSRLGSSCTQAMEVSSSLPTPAHNWVSSAFSSPWYLLISACQLQHPTSLGITDWKPAPFMQRWDSDRHPLSASPTLPSAQLFWQVKRTVTHHLPEGLALVPIAVHLPHKIHTSKKVPL